MPWWWRYVASIQLEENVEANNAVLHLRNNHQTVLIETFYIYTLVLIGVVGLQKMVSL